MVIFHVVRKCSHLNIFMIKIRLFAFMIVIWAHFDISLLADATLVLKDSARMAVWFSFSLWRAHILTPISERFGTRVTSPETQEFTVY